MTINHPVGGSQVLAAVSGTNMIVPSGSSLVIYMQNPGNVSVNDIGTTIGVTVFTANAQYYKESNVEAAQLLEKEPNALPFFLFFFR